MCVYVCGVCVSRKTLDVWSLSNWNDSDIEAGGETCFG